MPVFVYTARDKAGNKVDGTIDAIDRRTALAQIEKTGKIPVTVEERSAVIAKSAHVDGFKMWHGRADRMSMRDVLVFTTELSDLLASGMTLGNALNSLANRRTGTAEDNIVISIRDEIVRGSSLSEALALHPASFTTLYVSMIKAGEASGALAEVLSRIVVHYERIQEVKEKVVMALIYPLIVVLLGVVTLIFSMIFVIPKFQAIFAQTKQALPLPTKMLIMMSTVIAHYGILVLMAIVVLILVIRSYLKTEKGKTAWHGMLLKIPLLKGVIASSIYSNFARTLGVLLSNGVPVLQALGIVEKTVGNVIIAREIHNARDKVTDGTTISGPLADGKVFPHTMTDMLAIGEQTGDMSGALGHIARRYENELNRHVKIFTTALEPILIIIIAAMVGFIALSILLAVFDLSKGLNV